MEKIYAEVQTLTDYKTLEPERLADIEENQLYHLMLRNDGAGAEAYRAPVFLTQLQQNLALTTFNVLYVNRDLQPILKEGHPSRLVYNYWTPIIPLPLQSNNTAGLARTGYFVPYETALDTEFLEAFESISIPRS